MMIFRKSAESNCLLQLNRLANSFQCLIISESTNCWVKTIVVDIRGYRSLLRGIFAAVFLQIWVSWSMISQSSFFTKAICHSLVAISGLLWIEHFWLEHDQLNVPEFTLGITRRYSKLLNIISNDFQNQSWGIKKYLDLFGNVIQCDAANEFDSESVLNKIRILSS